jgi:transcriptional regulator with XRE-family HTH domain
MQPDPSPRHQAALPRGRPPNQLDPSSSAAARFGAELRALRLGAGLTIKALAELIGFSTTRISEVENGKGKLSRGFVEACERVLPAEDALLTLFEVVIDEEAAERHAKLAARRGGPTAERSSAPAVQSSQEVGAGQVLGSLAPILVHREVGTSNRREVLRVGGKLAGAVLSGKLLELLGTEPLAMTRALRTATVDATELDYHEATVARYMIEYEASGPLLLLAPVLELFQGVRHLVEDRQPIAYQRRLCRVGAKLATLLGIFAYEDQARSRAWFHTAQRAAQEADDNVLGAWALVKESLLPTYGGNPQEALALLGEGADLAGRSPSVVTAMVAASEARAHAIGRDEAAALAALERAERALDRAAPGERRLFAFSDAQLAFYRTSCHVRLDRSDADQAAAHALELYRASPHYMDPTLVRFDLATWYVQRGEVEEACRVGHEALVVIPAAHRTGPVVQRAQELLDGLEPYQANPAVRDFAEQLACG